MARKRVYMCVCVCAPRTACACINNSTCMLYCGAECRMALNTACDTEPTASNPNEHGPFTFTFMHNQPRGESPSYVVHPPPASLTACCNSPPCTPAYLQPSRHSSHPCRGLWHCWRFEVSGALTAQPISQGLPPQPCPQPSFEHRGETTINQQRNNQRGPSAHPLSCRQRWCRPYVAVQLGCRALSSGCNDPG